MTPVILVLLMAVATLLTFCLAILATVSINSKQTAIILWACTIVNFALTVFTGLLVTTAAQGTQ